MIGTLYSLTPLQTVIFYSFCASVQYLAIAKTFLRKITLFSFLIFSIYYFGLISVIKILLFGIFSLLLGKKIYQDNSLISLILGLFIAIQIHSVLGLIVGTQTSQNILYITEIIFILFSRKNITKELLVKASNVANSFNLVEIFLIFSVFIISSQPQQHFDAEYANLYNAKWYFESNSLTPIIESASSLFPQTGIIYYSYFYGIGGWKVMQIAYLLPLIFTILIIKNLSLQVKNRTLFTLATLSLLITPIFILTSTNGYYDSIITLCCFTIIFILLKEINIKNVLIIAFIIGFAGAIKYFPLILGLIPAYYLFFQIKLKLFQKTKYFLIISFLLLMPILVWAGRSYIYAGNPVFPFASKIFTTQKFYSSGDIDKNQMLQTSMSRNQWLFGGFVIYPISSFIKSNEFMQANKGYTTRAPILFNFLAIILIIYSIYILFRKKKLNTAQTLLIFTYISLIIIGVFIRYYRYLWPYQTTISLITIYILCQDIVFPKKYMVNLLNIFMVGLLLTNLKNSYDHRESGPISLNKLFQPDYYQQTHVDINNDPIIFLNQNVTKADTILDNTPHYLPRIFINSKVVICEAYWLNGGKRIKENNTLTLKLYKYIIVSAYSKKNTYCTSIINKNLNNLKTVFENKDYKILSFN